MNNWYVFSNDKVLGPYTQQQVQSLLDTNQLAMQDKICEADKQIWRMVSEFPEFNQQRKKGLWNRIFSNEDKKSGCDNTAEKVPAATEQFMVNDEDVRLSCPFCKQHYSVKRHMFSNQEISCRSCGKKFSLTLDPAIDNKVLDDAVKDSLSKSNGSIAGEQSYTAFHSIDGVIFSEDVPEGNITCPHCWRTFSPENVCYISSHPDLLGDDIAGEFEQKRFLPTVYHSDGLPMDSRGMRCTDMACPHCHLRLPASIVDLDSIYFSIAGAPSSGKSYFLTSMVHDLRKTLPQHNYSFYDVDPVINRVINSYEDTIFMAADSSQVVSLPKTQQIGNDFSNQITKNGVTFELPKPFIFRFQSSNLLPKNNRIDRNLIFYDNAGEHFQPGADSIANPATIHLTHSNGIIFLFDPLNDANMRKDCDHRDPQTMLNTKITDQTTLFAEMVNRIRRHGNMNSEQISDIPLIIAIGKYDAWKNMLPKKIEEIEIFHENPDDFSLEIDMNAIMDVSFAMREMMMETATGLVSQAETFFRRVFFVPVSSFGCLASKTESGNIGIIPANLAPVWVSVPLLLLLAENGFINKTAKCENGNDAVEISCKIMDDKILFRHPVNDNRVILPCMYAGTTLEIEGKYYHLPDLGRNHGGISGKASSNTDSVWR